MNNFINKNELKELVQEYDTPMYLYDRQRLEENIMQLKNLCKTKNVKINYATKANSNIELLKIIKENNLKVDATGIGEVEMNQHAGFDDKDIYVVCNNLNENELKKIIEQNLIISVDSIDQLKLIGKIKKGYNKILLRINPSFGAGENQSIITGGTNHKFGIDIQDFELALEIIEQNEMTLIGINQHIGSLNLNYKSITNAVEELLEFVTENHLDNLQIINFGGGFGIDYKRNLTSERLDLDTLGKKLDDIFNDFLNKYPNKNVSLEFEPGRFVVANTSILVGQVTSLKKRGEKIFIGTDLGFSNFMRPVLYNSYHEIDFVTENKDVQKANVVGNMCESGDYIAQDREIVIPNIGDLVIVYDTGAYGYSMASNYNSRFKPIEILKENKGFRVIRKRQTIKDLL